jgi:phage gp36-like protein
MPTLTSITPLASAERSASGVGSAVDLGAATTAELTLDVTAATGAELEVTVETAKSNTATTWRSLSVAFTAVTDVGAESVTFAGLDRYIRVRWTLTGTATFGVSGSSVLVYCAPADMDRVIAERALFRDQDQEFTAADKDGYAQDATDEVSASLAAMFALPLSAWGRDVRRKTAELAVWMAMLHRGFSPESESGQAYRQMHDDVQKWLGLVRDQKIELQGVTDSTPDVEDGGAYVVTDASRGWGRW